MASRIASGPTSALKDGTSEDAPLNIELKLEVWDSPNSAGVIIDALAALASPWIVASGVRSLDHRPTS